MEVKYSIKGQNTGRISPLMTIATMEVNETWETSREEVNYDTLRFTCSYYGRTSGKFFSVSSPVESEGLITVTRIR